MKHRRSGSGFPGSARLIGRNFRNEKNAVLIDLIHVKEVGGSAYVIMSVIHVFVYLFLI